ncbi:hypothetical protein ACQZV8_19145 [Magnetococcales bacterium HHB-1]
MAVHHKVPASNPMTDSSFTFEVFIHTFQAAMVCLVVAFLVSILS